MKNFILIGANSELATSFAEELKLNKFNIYSISRKVVPYLSENNQIQLEDYIENCKDILSFIKNIEDPYVVFLTVSLQRIDQSTFLAMQKLHKQYNLTF